jgi:hypothetical protein
MPDDVKNIAAAIAGRKTTVTGKPVPPSAKRPAASATRVVRSKVVTSPESDNTLNNQSVDPASLRESRGLPAQVPQVPEGKSQRTQAQYRQLLDMVQDTIMRGLTDEQASAELGLEMAELKRHQGAILDRFVTNLQQQTTFQVYAHYVLEQKSCIVELQQMINGFRSSKQHNAMVGAVKAKSEILDKIISKGQDMGIIEKRAKRIEFIGSLDVRNMTELDIAREIMVQMQQINELVDGGIIDAELVEEPKKLTGS